MCSHVLCVNSKWKRGKSRSCFVGMCVVSRVILLWQWAGLGPLHCVKMMCLLQEDGVQIGGIASSRLKGRVGSNCTSQDLLSLDYGSDPVA